MFWVQNKICFEPMTIWIEPLPRTLQKELDLASDDGMIMMVQNHLKNNIFWIMNRQTIE